MSEERKSLLQSLGLHFAIALVLMLSVVIGHQAIPQPMAPQAVIQATFIDAQAIYDKQQAALAAAQEQERQAEQRRQAELRRKEAARKKAAQEKAKKEREAKERAKQRELERKAQEAAERKRQQEAEAQRKAEEQAKRDAERREQEALDRLMEQQMEAERAAQARRRSQQVLSEVEQYRALIYQTIQQYIYEDDSFTGKQCILNIRMASTGLVTQVTVIEGDPALCRASRSAALRPDRLPMSDNLDVYEQFKDFNLRVTL